MIFRHSEVSYLLLMMFQRKGQHRAGSITGITVKVSCDGKVEPVFTISVGNIDGLPGEHSMGHHVSVISLPIHVQRDRRKGDIVTAGTTHLQIERVVGYDLQGKFAVI
jgi:hypothetical protein